MKGVLFMTEQIVIEEEMVQEEMPMFEEPEDEVYIQVDENGLIRRVEALWNLASTEGFIKVASGNGDVYRHCQSAFLQHFYGEPMFDEQGRFSYKFVDGEIVLLTEEEKEILFPKAPTPASFEEEQLDFNLDIDYRVTCLELGTIAE